MNKQTEALTMAIEAFRNIGIKNELLQPALDACKEALKSQEQEYDINEMIDKITPENLQEPVCAVQDGEARWYYAVPENGTLLYTHPARPLSKTAERDYNFMRDLAIGLEEGAQALSVEELEAISDAAGVCMVHGHKDLSEKLLQIANDNL